MDRTETAYHEAGHAVVSYYRGLPIESADVVETEGRAGVVVHADPPENWDIGIYGEEMEAWYFGHIMSTVAGVQAVEILNGRPAHRDDPNLQYWVPGSDYATVGLLFGELGPEALQRAYDEAEQVLRENWRAVRAVASALLQHKTLDKESLYSVFEEAGCSRDEESAALVEEVYRSVEYEHLCRRRFELAEAAKTASEEEMPALEQEFLRVDRQVVAQGGDSWITRVRPAGLAEGEEEKNDEE